MPQSGELLILSDGRRFRLSSAGAGPRGWWFHAIAQDGSSTLQGNLELHWDVQAEAWRPAGTPAVLSPSIPLPPSMRAAATPKWKQLG